jgi:lysylphosphatidylglycerol synthetase-like protein (DUF2156 family)
MPLKLSMPTARRLWPSGAQLHIVVGDLARADAVLAGANLCDPAANAALTGDKRFLFSPTGRSFLSYGQRGGLWVALGGPVGQADEATALCAQFLQTAREFGTKGAFYNVRSSFAPIAEALGLRMMKTGERALLDLTTFTLDGKTRQVIRTHRNRHMKQGFQVVVESAGASRSTIERLRSLSDQWLTHQPGGAEKGFGLGRFAPHYVDRLPLATVRSNEGVVMAFATLWPTADKSRIGVDLMRFGDDGPNGVMDYLFAEMFLWAKAEGYRQFDLNTSPGSGVRFDPRVPLTSYLGQQVFEHGERFYNFKGVQRFKRKFHPDWEDVCVAWPRGVSPLWAMISAARLTNQPHFPESHFSG